MPTWVNTSDNCTEGLRKTQTFLRDRRIALAAGLLAGGFFGPRHGQVGVGRAGFGRRRGGCSLRTKQRVRRRKPMLREPKFLGLEVREFVSSGKKLNPKQPQSRLFGRVWSEPGSR